MALTTPLTSLNNYFRRKQKKSDLFSRSIDKQVRRSSCNFVELFNGIIEK